MKYKYSYYAAALVILSALLMAACATNMDTTGYHRMSAAEIRHAVAGNTFYEEGYSNGGHWQWAGYHAADGTSRGRAWWNGGKDEGKGTWEVTDNNLFCSHWPRMSWDKGRRACFHLYRKGDVIISKTVTKGIKNSKVTLEKGNPYNL